MRTFFFVLICLLILVSCQPTSVKTDETVHPVDSTLFFKQVDIDDPFFTALDQSQHQRFTLKKTILPPPPPVPEEPEFIEIDGYRVQVFAGVDSMNAFSNATKAKQIVTDTIYVVNETRLFKLQAGNYLYYPQADSIKRRFRRQGFPGAWVVQRKIQIPVTEEASDSLDNNLPEIQQLEKGKYKIQVIATADEHRAKEIGSELYETLQVKAFYEKSGNLFKVYVGYYNSEQLARQVLNKIRKTNFPDAWLVY